MAGLQKFLKALPEAAGLELSTLTAERTGDHLEASVWGQAQQVLPGLCRAELRTYLGSTGSRNPVWEAARQTSAVWLQGGDACVRSDSAVMMSAELSDRSALRLLQTGERLRERAALLIGGTSGCRRTLYYDLRLSGVVTESANAWRPGWQITLTYVTREAEVQVGFRFTDGDLWPWKVTCPP